MKNIAIFIGMAKQRPVRVASLSNRYAYIHACETQALAAGIWIWSNRSCLKAHALWIERKPLQEARRYIGWFAQRIERTHFNLLPIHNPMHMKWPSDGRPVVGGRWPGQIFAFVYTWLYIIFRLINNVCHWPCSAIYERNCWSPQKTQQTPQMQWRILNTKTAQRNMEQTTKT